MTVRASLQLADPSNQLVTLTLTATLGEFEELSREIATGKVPAYRVQDLQSKIFEATRRLRDKIQIEADKDPDQ